MVDRSGAVDLRKAYQDAHKAADTDFEDHSIHHTLGAGPRQAAPGNHRHEDTEIAVIALQESMGNLPLQVAELALPVGAVILSAVQGDGLFWLECDGRSLLRSEYGELFNAIGVTYGSVDLNHFNLPLIKGRVPVGISSTETEFDAMGKTGGHKAMQQHSHSTPNHQHTGLQTGGVAIGWNSGGTAGVAAGAVAGIRGVEAAAVTTNNSGGGITGLNGSGNAQNLQPYITLTFMIKVIGGSA